jgi:hypothetical protein
MKNETTIAKEVLNISLEILTDDQLASLHHDTSRDKVNAVEDHIQWLLLRGLLDVIEKEIRKRVEAQQFAFNLKAMSKCLSECAAREARSINEL